MAKYDTHILEEELKNKVATDWFAAYDTTRIIGKVDFCVAIPATELGLYGAENALWAEAKGKEKMNATSADETYNGLLATLKAAMKNLAAKIEPKVYEYGFLRS